MTEQTVDFGRGPDLDLGDGHALWFTSSLDGSQRIGYIQQHPFLGQYGRWCVSSGMFDVPYTAQHFSDRPKWRVESMEPLTLSPSLLCRTCGDHGFIRDGRWQAA